MPSGCAVAKVHAAHYKQLRTGQSLPTVPGYELPELAPKPASTSWRTL